MAASDGSKRGKASVDWEAAFAYYASLPPGERSYAAVGAHFGVSPRTVETHGRTDGWKKRMHDINTETAARTHTVLADARVEEVQKIRKLVDASFIAYAERLRDGMRMTPADLERLNRVSLALIEEATNPRLRPPDETVDSIERTPEHTAAVLDALEEIGALEAIGLTRINPVPGDPDATVDPLTETTVAKTSKDEPEETAAAEPTPIEDEAPDDCR